MRLILPMLTAPLASSKCQAPCDMCPRMPSTFRSSRLHYYSKSPLMRRTKQPIRFFSVLPLTNRHEKQDAGPGRSKLAQAFNRWRLQTCDAAVEDTASSLLSRGGGSNQAWDIVAGGGSTRPRENARTVKELWEAAGGADQEQDVHALVMTKARADRPLPSELCEAFEREMVERINRRQAENNVPILPMPFC